MTKVFICYRRSDSSEYAARLEDAMVARLGERSVFRDVAGIEFGEDFPRRLKQALDACDVVLVVIGPDWLSVAAESGELRLNQPDDFVRQELEYAMQASKRIVPVLVRGATMPAVAELPDSLRALSNAQSFAVREQSARADLESLASRLQGEHSLLVALQVYVGAALGDFLVQIANSSLRATDQIPTDFQYALLGALTPTGALLGGLVALRRYFRLPLEKIVFALAACAFALLSAGLLRGLLPEDLRLLRNAANGALRMGLLTFAVVLALTSRSYLRTRDIALLALAAAAGAALWGSILYAETRYYPIYRLGPTLEVVAYGTVQAVSWFAPTMAAIVALRLHGRIDGHALTRLLLGIGTAALAAGLIRQTLQTLLRPEDPISSALVTATFFAIFVTGSFASAEKLRRWELESRNVTGSRLTASGSAR